MKQKSYLLVLLFLFIFLGNQETLEGKTRGKLRRTEALVISPNHYQIHSRVEFFGIISPGTWTEKMMAYSLSEVEKIWNRHGYFTVQTPGKKPKKIQLTFRFTFRIRRGSEKPTPGYHQIEIVSIPAEYLKHKLGKKSKLMDGYRSWMYRGGRSPGKVTGTFGFPINIATMAHEFGHLWGLRDEYPKGETAWIRLQKRLRQLAKMEWPPSIMDLSFFPLATPKARHYRQIYRSIRKYHWLKKSPQRGH